MLSKDCITYEYAAASTKTGINYFSNFTRIRKEVHSGSEQYSDGNNGKCATGVLMSYFGCDGKHRFDTTNTLQFALYALKKSVFTLVQ